MTVFSFHSLVCVFELEFHQIAVNPLDGVILGLVTLQDHPVAQLYTVAGVHSPVLSVHPFPFTLKFIVILL